MVIVETIALSTMVCNDLVMPVLLRVQRLCASRERAISRACCSTSAARRSSRSCCCGYFYYLLAGEAYALVSIGLISFAAVAQFAPAVIGGLYWKGGTRDGALAGLVAGFAVWLYTLLLPAFAKSGWLGNRTSSSAGPFGHRAAQARRSSSGWPASTRSPTR